MNLNTRSGTFEEIELKLALPTTDISSLAKRLARTPVLARRKATRMELHNVYYDTPAQRLRQQCVALRIRRIGSDAKPQWLQTLKTGGRDNSALSRRGEWETPVSGPIPSLEALEASPWSDIDPDGTAFAALVPKFVTAFERISWRVRRRGGGVVEVSLDIGRIVAGNKQAAICELEFELLAGPPIALFEVAQQIADTIAVLPLSASKADRGYALAQDSLDTPTPAQPPKLTPELPLSEAARRVLGETFCQFTTNLVALRTSQDPELVHQARVGWRRFKSALRLFKPIVAAQAVPSWQALQALLTGLGDLRILEVAQTDTLPSLADAYVAGDARRAQAWQAMAEAMAHATDLQRKTVRRALQEPTVGATLLSTTQWLEELTVAQGSGDERLKQTMSLRRWARRRILHLHDQLQRACEDVESPESQHRARIIAKRLRYGIEAMSALLPQKRTKRWLRKAMYLQTRLGVARDIMQAAAAVRGLDTNRALVEFLRGVSVGQTRPR